MGTINTSSALAARVVSEETLACLLQLQQPGLVDAYLETVSIEDSELTIFDRKRRNAVSLMVGLGEPAIPDLCRWVGGAAATPATGSPRAPSPPKGPRPPPIASSTPRSRPPTPVAARQPSRASA
jgi:hypothetical protein